MPAASSPPPMASAKLCHVTTRCVADREGSRQVAGYIAKEVARQQLADPEPERRSATDAKHERVEQQYLDHHRGVVTGEAQVDDQAPPLRNRQQHRAEREQEPDHRAERGEQRGRLAVSAAAACSNSSTSKSASRTLTPSPAKRLRPARTRSTLPSGTHHEDPRHPAFHPGEPLGIRERGGDDRTVDERADVVRGRAAPRRAPSGACRPRRARRADRSRHRPPLRSAPAAQAPPAQPARSR